MTQTKSELLTQDGKDNRKESKRQINDKVFQFYSLVRSVWMAKRANTFTYIDEQMQNHSLRKRDKILKWHRSHLSNEEKNSKKTQTKSENTWNSNKN